MKKTKRTRGQGRPSGEVAVGEKALVAAARNALRTTPPGELTFQQVATLAGVNQRLIRYYFGSMAELLRAAAIEITSEIRERIKAATTQGDSPRQQVRNRVAIFVETFGANPYYHRLVVDYLFIHAGPERDDAVTGLQNSIRELDQLLQSEGASNAVKPMDARLAHITMAALCEFLFSARPVFVALFGDQAKASSFQDRFCDFVTDLLCPADDKP